MYKLTDKSLENLQNDGVPFNELRNLGRIKDKSFDQESEFLHAVKNVIRPEEYEPEEYDRYIRLILKHAKPLKIEYPRDFGKCRAEGCNMYAVPGEGYCYTHL